MILCNEKLCDMYLSPNTITVVRFWWLAKGSQVLQNYTSHHKVLGAMQVTLTSFHSQDPQILGTTIQSVVTQVTLHPGFVHPWVGMGETSAYIILVRRHLGNRL
jgi:hypothetical protein